MALKALPNDVRSILTASAQINNYKTAVEELVYNSLDAESTSIAIRIQIQENRIQVIDNGHGILKNDFDLIGQRYTTSKLTDLSSLESLPKYYGYRGEFLANIIEISHVVRIISRHKEGEETWAKTFYKGKKKQLTKMTTRPSKGTTVEIQQFLYNLNIQSRGIDPVNELQSIKASLEQLSLVHNNISLSLRDDSCNEIIFKIHKKRDIYQTLTTLFNINKDVLQELQIEKNQYKVKALIGKADNQIGRHWIYLNGKFMNKNTKLHRIINEYLKKYVLISDRKATKFKINHDEDHLFKQAIPFYFIFITCPYIDYDVSSTSRQTIVEFKNWEQMKKMLEKLVKFYVGDINVTEINKNEKKVTVNQDNDSGPRDQIKQIINKILESHTKKLDVSQLQNGVKGKLIKRKNKKKVKKNDYRKLSLKRIEQNKTVNKLTQKNISSGKNNDNNPLDHNFNNNENISISKLNNTSNILENYVIASIASKIKKKKTHFKVKNKNNKLDQKRPPPKIGHEIIKKRKIKLNTNNNFKNIKNDLGAFQLLKKSTFHEKRNIKTLDVEDFLGSQSNCHQLDRIDAKVCLDTNLHTKDKYLHNYKELFIRNMCEDTIGNYVIHTNKANPFKTTYDLVQTILKTQQEKKIKHNDRSRLEDQFNGYSVISTRIKSRLPIRQVYSKTTNIQRYSMEGRESGSNIISNNLVSYKLTCENTYTTKKSTDIYCKCKGTSDYITPIVSMQHSLRCDDIFKENSSTFYSNDNLSHYLTSMPSTSELTYKSHNYIHRDTNRWTNNENNNERNLQSTRFITKRSRDNFITKTDKCNTLFKNNRAERRRTVKHTKNYSEHIGQTIDESYTIEFTNSNKNNYLPKLSSVTDFGICNPNDYTKCLDQNLLTYNIPTSGFGDTYSIHSHNITSNCGNYTQNKMKNINRDRVLETYEPIPGFGNTYSIQTHGISSVNNTPSRSQEKYVDCDSLFASKTEKADYDVPDNHTKEDNQNKESSNIMFISDLQCSEDEVLNEHIDPINVCEAVFFDGETFQNEFAFSFNRNSRLNDSLYNNFGLNYSNNIQVNDGDVSHHFSNTAITKHDNINPQKSSFKSLVNENKFMGDLQNHGTEGNVTDDHHTLPIDNKNNFDFKERLRFLPKGMSQIFEKCGSKILCSYNLDKDYYEKDIYNDFANDICMQTEIYEPIIQNVEDLATKDIHKFKNKVHKDNTSLVFDETSLKEAQVLNQVDCKFIATIMKEKYQDSIVSEYLVLFDQHAVHERIRLEKNLTVYFNEDKWKSVPLENITLKMTKDEVLYLHNYKDKFNQLGLQWNILNKDEISLTSIPEAILGKNPREVEKVIKAVKNLIVEEINVIKLQKGCISLYPKSIMDLVFSEACRYAIKFGDKLSKNDCIQLISDLSNCKTPFQCAHGRPVMAVLVDVKRDERDYKVDIESLRQFKAKMKITT